MATNTRISCGSISFAIATLSLALIISKANADCNYTNTSSGNGNTTYKLSCVDACTQWKLYILDYPVPLAGACSTLPCLVDTASISSTALRAQIGWKATNKPCSIVFSTTTAGNLLILAQSFFNVKPNVATHVGEVMIRSVRIPIPSNLQPSSAMVATVTMPDPQQVFIASQNLSATQTPAADTKDDDFV